MVIIRHSLIKNLISYFSIVRGEFFFPNYTQTFKKNDQNRKTSENLCVHTFRNYTDWLGNLPLFSSGKKKNYGNQRFFSRIFTITFSILHPSYFWIRLCHPYYLQKIKRFPCLCFSIFYVWKGRHKFSSYKKKISCFERFFQQISKFLLLSGKFFS